MTIGGYVLVDASGLDTLSESTQTITGLYASLTEALSTGKMIIIEHLDADGAIISPAPALLVAGEDEYTVTVGTVVFTVDEDDEVIIGGDAS